jgi:glycine/D-amino acid oxidase-like deaminating enzyme
MRDNVPVWETGNWKGLASLDGDANADLVVVGLGGSGLAAVLEARSRGLSVIGIDAGMVAGGAAGRNGGFLLAGTAHFYHDAVATSGRARALALYRATLAELARIEAETPEDVRITGSLRIAWSDDEIEDCRAQLDAMERDALPAEWYSGPEGEGLLIPTDGVYQPLERCRTLATRAIEAGAVLYENTRASAISGGHVRTPLGCITCSAVIVAVDGGLHGIFPELYPRVRTARLQMLATAPAPEVQFTRPVYARYGYEYWQQLPDRRIALGGFRDKYVNAEWTTDATPSADIQSLLEQHLRDIGVTAPIERRWAASVGYTEDLLPVFEEVRPRVWAIGAYCGTGNVIGAMCGRAAAGCATGERQEIADLLRPPVLHMDGAIAR